MNHLFRVIYLVVCIAIVSCSSSKKTGQTRRPTSASSKVEDKKLAARVSNNSQQVLAAIETARSFTGTPYRYGGTTRAGMDCSGLMLISYQSAGLKLPRTANEQSNFGKKSSLESLQEGDLVFFAANKGSGKITHVGLVTEVKGKHDVKFIHASTKLGVVENNIYSDYYRRIFVKARRPF